MLDKEKLRKKLAILEGKEKDDRFGDKDSVIIKLEIGETILRLFPGADGDPIKSFHFHYLNRKPYVCLKRNWNEKCPICEYSFSLYSEETEASRKIAKKFMPTERFFAVVVKRGEEEKGPKIWAFSQKQYTRLTEIMLDPEYGEDITDPSSGRDLKVKKVKAKTEGAYDEITVDPKGSSSPLAKDKALLKEWLSHTIDINKECVERKTYEELEEVLSEFVHRATAKVEKDVFDDQIERNSIDDVAESAQNDE